MEQRTKELRICAKANNNSSQLASFYLNSADPYVSTLTCDRKHFCKHTFRTTNKPGVCLTLRGKGYFCDINLSYDLRDRYVLLPLSTNFFCALTTPK